MEALWQTPLVSYILVYCMNHLQRIEEFPSDLALSPFITFYGMQGIRWHESLPLPHGSRISKVTTWHIKDIYGCQFMVVGGTQHPLLSVK